MRCARSTPCSQAERELEEVIRVVKEPQRRHLGKAIGAHGRQDRRLVLQQIGMRRRNRGHRVLLWHERRRPRRWVQVCRPASVAPSRIGDGAPSRERCWWFHCTCYLQACGAGTGAATDLVPVAPIGGAYTLPLSAEHGASAGVAAGDTVEVDLEPDTEPQLAHAGHL